MSPETTIIHLSLRVPRIHKTGRSWNRCWMDLSGFIHSSQQIVASCKDSVDLKGPRANFKKKSYTCNTHCTALVSSLLLLGAAGLCASANGRCRINCHHQSHFTEKTQCSHIQCSECSILSCFFWPIIITTIPHNGNTKTDFQKCWEIH